MHTGPNFIMMTVAVVLVNGSVAMHHARRAREHGMEFGVIWMRLSLVIPYGTEVGE